jgi:hypothetical protein
VAIYQNGIENSHPATQLIRKKVVKIINNIKNENPHIHMQGGIE